ncbi:MAG: acyl-CoA dehydrogenase, partial [Gammaproteobacteria bacterium]|nr:acyl-CoA dehydrogenase [Gammaproteobacteria bacterium]
PIENRLGREGGGTDLAMGMLNFTRPLIGAQGTGLATGVFERTLEYAKKHKTRLAPSFDVVKYKLAEMAIKIECSRQLVYRSAFLSDSGHSDAGKFCSMAKYFPTDAAMEICIEAMQIFGSLGYTSDYPIERFMRDAKVLQIYEGTNQIQRVTLAKTLLS